MKPQIHRPDASAIVNSLRAIGYSFNTAVADIIDNSIAAGASSIDVGFRRSPEPYVAILDNGSGMSAAALLAAMKHGGGGPSGDRDPRDLGRYGLGLKTASLSQCRELTVITLASGVLNSARWDIDVIEATADWCLQILDEDDIAGLPRIAELLAQEHGTVVLWRRFDRIAAGAADPVAAVERVVAESFDHLSLVFHRYLSTQPGEKRCNISINWQPLEPYDPFITSNPLTDELQTECVTIADKSVIIRPFILPHISKITESQLRCAGGGERLRQNQGFYVYRNRRLITYGTWFRLLRHHELTKLARVSIDIPNSLDHIWDLDVKKSTANPPEAVKARLRRIIDRIAERGANVFRERRRRTAQTEATYLWDRTKIRNASIYSINRAHPLVTALRASLDKVNAPAQLEHLLLAVEISLPTNSIYADMAADQSVERAPDEIEAELVAMAEALLATLPATEQNREAMIARLMSIDPFCKYAAQTRRVTERLRDA
jgi:Histidine kinase-, DNA gyrase B-, and HSP90-like ATPase